MPNKPRILVIHTTGGANPLAGCEAHADLICTDSMVRALVLIQKQKFDGVYADTTDLTLLQQAGTVLQADRILEMLADGVAIVDPHLRIQWSNAEFDRWCGAPAEGKNFYETIGSPDLRAADGNPFHSSMLSGEVSTCLLCPRSRSLQIHVTPIKSAQGDISHFILLGRDVTQERLQQQKLDAIHRAGRELAALDPTELTVMSSEERIELLKLNILHTTKELLHFEVIDVRLVDPKSGKLELLIAEGMSPDAVARKLFVSETGNGVTGFVAATGKSYLCPNIATDPHYIKGAEGAKSSLTVPLIYQDRVIGTFNVESPNANAFTEQDRQFLEIFSRDIAEALHTLELLVAEQRSTATQSIEAISREVAIPVDEILNNTTAILDRYIGHEPEIAQKLKHILVSVRSIKESIQRVGETITPPDETGKTPEPRRPRLRGMRVLVADSDDRVRRSAHSILGRFGCVVETARDGKEALVMARLGSYQVILADIRLPDMTGYEVFHQLRKEQPSAHVILMSVYGYDPSHSIVKARQEGLRWVLYKPFRVDQLLTVLEDPLICPTEVAGSVPVTPAMRPTLAAGKVKA